MRRAGAVGIAIFAGMILASDAIAADVGETHVQDNGLMCKPEAGEFRFFQRSARGIKNISTVERSVFCPITGPSFDSDEFAVLKVKQADVFINQVGSQPRCRLYSMKCRRNESGPFVHDIHFAHDGQYFSVENKAWVRSAIRSR